LYNGQFRTRIEISAMKKFLLWISLVLVSATATGHHDLWHGLFQEKLQEAGKGDSEAQYDVGSMYQNGRGVAASRAQAIEWYRKAAAQGNAKAVSRLQLMEANEARFNRTVTLARKGDRESLFEAGHMYSQGIGTEIDIARAIASWEQSAGMGHARSAWKLGLLYYDGTGIQASSTQAFKWFRLAAEGGLPAAQYYLGKMYATGQGTQPDNTLALEWLSKAVDGGFDQARGEMINVMELIAQASSPDTAVPPPEAPPVKVARAKPAPQPAPRKPVRQPAANPAAKHYSLEDLMLGAWSRDGEPVAFLPSTTNNCRTESGKLICYSYELTRQTTTHDIRYKTKSIIEDFSSKGSFTVTYRNLVIESTPLADGNGAGNDADDADTFTVKTGWGSPHSLECEFGDDGALSCMKNGAHALSLVHTPTVTAGK
jgi:hypothetical protein